ncbi:SMC-Scp complex subunit ScpB [Phormidium sp. CLA17]|uniref:SMC-Scp complex subunit ScpB n=1 Tax=Leptolyngbya sp. Cla-17 TaxID=2803751 RepID=UPI001491B635|nr:SMC-Scp complex subunit ScpB [Leptolyngbya sp. Cla-17]MBM0744045.1 SMC-Scp complex subunit ScpB [Leptolyngbya sp. Cla-17]
MTHLSSTIEAILYLKAQPLTVIEIAEYARCDRAAAKEALLELMEDYAHRDSALEVTETPSGYSLQLRDTFHSLIQTLLPADVGLGALRTLAAIALKGKISQTDLVEIRGSNVYQHVQELVELGFVRKRKQSDGRSFWLQVTEKFHQYFQLNSDQTLELTQYLGNNSTPSPTTGETLS